MALLIILQGRKSIRACRVGVVVQAAAADVGDIDSGPDCVLISGPDEDLSEGDVILSL